MQISDNGVDFIKTFEGFVPYWYDDLQPGKRINQLADKRGTYTIGYGTTELSPKHPPISPDLTISESTAAQYLKYDLAEAEQKVRRAIKVPLTQSQYDALVSFAYNTGRSTSNLFSLINSNAPLSRIKDFWTTKYITSKGVYLPGLKRRRNAEYELFATGNYQNNFVLYTLLIIALIVASLWIL